MNDPRMTQLVPVERVERLIHLVRGEKVLLDADLAVLYGVTTGNLNKAVKRNQQRFPPDFMFQLTDAEAMALIFQSGNEKSATGLDPCADLCILVAGVMKLGMHSRGRKTPERFGA